MRYTLTFSDSFPKGISSAELEGEKISCNDVALPRSIDPDVSSFAQGKLYVIGHEFGAVCAVWADHAQDALDNAVNANMLDCFIEEDQTQDNEDGALTHLGNAGELFNLDNAWVGEVDFDAARDIQLIVGLVRASEAGLNTIGEWR